MPKPGKNESKKDFLGRCMAYPDMQKYKPDQRYAICLSLWENRNKKKEEAALRSKPKSYPNEHACRIRDPGEFQEDSFRRIKQGKLSIIIGRLKGKKTTTTQAFRYPVGEWTEKEARAHCKRQGGKFAPATKKTEKTESMVLVPQTVDLQEPNYICPNCGSNNRTIVSSITYENDRPNQFSMSCGWCNRQWVVSSKLVLNNIIEDQINNLRTFTRKVGKEFGAIILSTSRGIVLDMCQIGEERAINLSITRKLEPDEKVLGSFHCHPITDTPSYWDVGTFLKYDWEKVSMVVGAKGTLTVMVKTKNTKKLEANRDIEEWREETLKRGLKLEDLSAEFGFEVYRGKPMELYSLTNKREEKSLTLEKLVREHSSLKK